MSDIESVLDVFRISFGILLSSCIASGRISNSTRAALRSSCDGDTPQANMAPAATKARYPKRKRATVNYDVEKSFADVSDIEDDGDGYHSEELGEDSTISAGNNAAGAASAASAQPSNPVTATPNIDDHDSEYEDATFGSRRKIKKRKVVGRDRTVNGQFQAKPKPEPKPKFMPFRLMDLPTELRLKVYDEALVDPDGVTIRTFNDKYESTPVHVAASNIRTAYFVTTKWYYHGNWTEVPANQLPRKKNQLSPNLIAASKFIHEEAVSKLWEQPFLFSDVQGLHAFLLVLRPETIARLRNITILQHGWNNPKVLPAFVLLRDAPLLKNLRLDCRVRPDTRSRRSHSQDDSVGQQLATKLYSNCHPFLKALVKERGSEAILEVFKFTREEFKSNYYDPVANRWVRIDWSEEREKNILAAMDEELKVIMNRTIVPRFRQYRY